MTVVTGAAGALGSELAAELVERGHRVAAIDMPAAAARLDAIAEKLGKACLAVPLDVASTVAWTAALARVQSELGVPTGAVLVAGAWRGGTPFAEEKDEATWRAMLDANLETAQRSLRALLPGMVEHEHGSVVVIGSRAVERPWESAGASGYAASKSALVALARTLAAELVESGVRINAVLPSTLDTRANRAAMPDADPARWVGTRSLARVIAFLLSDDARDVSGAALPVYGRV